MIMQWFARTDMGNPMMLAVQIIKHDGMHHTETTDALKLQKKWLESMTDVMKSGLEPFDVTTGAARLSEMIGDEVRHVVTRDIPEDNKFMSVFGNERINIRVFYDIRGCISYIGLL